MKKIALMIAAAVPAVAFAAPQATIYGQLHLSADYVNSDVTKEQKSYATGLSDGSLNLSSNSSRFGLKGELESGLENLKVIYQIESGFNVDGGDSTTGYLASRNSYLGARYLADKAMTFEVLGGRHDTLGKMTMGKNLFKDHVADYGAIFGASAAGGNKFDTRVNNMVLGRYIRNIEGGNLVVSAQASSDAGNANNTAKTVDDSKQTFHAVGVDLNQGPLSVAVAYDHWNNYSADADADILRAFVSYKMGDWTAVGLGENVRNTGALNRKAYGAQLGYKADKWFYAGQVLQAADARDTQDTGATMVSLSAQKTLTDSLAVYGVATRTHNEDNAKFNGVDGGHGNKLKTVADANPYALSVGAVLKF